MEEEYPALKAIAEINPKLTEQIFDFNDQIHRQINDTGSHITKIVQEHEKDFLSAFEQKMYVIQADMKNLKAKTNM